MVPSDVALGDNFGISVGISNDRVIVGSHGDDGFGDASGSAYVFVREGEEWKHEATLTAADAAANAFFGTAVALENNYAVVGSRDKAYIFRRIESAWAQDTMFTSYPNSQFGSAVAINGDCIMVGATHASAVHVFKYNGTTWIEQEKLNANDTDDPALFGWAVDIDSVYAIASAIRQSQGANESGAAYVFRYNGTTWVQEAKLKAATPWQNGAFGYSVAISGSRALIGAIIDFESDRVAGAAYVFQRNNTNWMLVSKLVPDDVTSGDGFCYAVALDGKKGIVGAAFDDDNGNNAGAAYVYQLPDSIVDPPPPDEPFAETSALLPGVAWSSAAWGDYDNDGDLDVLLTGNTGSGYISKIYRNDNGTFVDISASLLGVWEGSVAWGDYDNDGDLDILLTGNTAAETPTPNPVSIIYRNDAGTFVNAAVPLKGVFRSSVAWGDYDNDGDLDILLTGESSSGYVSSIYRNEGGNFVEISAGLTGVHYGSVAWGDYDKDSDFDILLTGDTNNAPTPVAQVYRNDSGIFAAITASIQPAYATSVGWGDFNSDGFLDVLLTGNSSGTTRISSVYRNLGASFTDISASLMPAGYGSAAWGDFDNDGDFDILQTGETDGGRITKIYRNNNGGFVDINASLTGVYTSSASWGDYDGDGDLDILLTGQPTSDGPIAKIYRNNSSLANTAPTSPASLVAAVDKNSVTLSWNKSTDTETPQNGLTYNLRVGTTPGGTQIVSPMADVNTGYRKVPKLGNTNHNTSWIIKNLAPGTYYWSVQAIDNAFAGSPFAPEQSFVIVGTGDTTPPATPQNLIAIAGNQQATLTWQANNEADFLRYRIYGGTSPNPTTKIDSVNGAANTTKIIASLTNGTTYYFRITAVDNSLNQSGFSNEVNATPSAVDLPPTAPQNLTASAGDQQITLNWQTNSETDFLRYRIHGGTSPNPTTKIDSVNGAANTAKTITGLTNGTTYYFRITAVDNNLNQSGFSNEVNATPTAADLPPAAPQNLQATPGPAHGQITLSWEANSETDLLRYRIYGGRATAPAALLDSVAANANTSFTFSDLTIGTTYAYFLTAVDASGQASAPSNSASAAPLRDTQAPFIDMPSYSIFVDLNTDAPVRVNVTDLSQINAVHIFYRTGGEASFLNKQMILQTDGSYFRNIPSIVMTTRGAEFYLTARDVHGNLATSKRYLLRVNCAEGIINPAMQPAGTKTNNFRIFSVPLDLDDKSPQAFVAANPLLEPPDATKYRWYACDRSTGALQEYPDFSNITLAPDMGFPLLANLKNFRLKTGSGKTMSISDVHHVALPAGWSLIGNPFNFAIPYDSLRVSDGATFELWSFNGDWQLNRAGLEPWQGYAIHLNRAATLFISPGVAGLSEGAAAHAVANNEGENWLMQIIASNGRSESRCGICTSRRAWQIRCKFNFNRSRLQAG
ncbi:VCBS repeat-containing protein [candidate division KSB1 bacterium]|nr:VCBS repeat-containing protein [candidate division KSB1 bacterium]